MKKGEGHDPMPPSAYPPGMNPYGSNHAPPPPHGYNSGGTPQGYGQQGGYQHGK